MASEDQKEAFQVSGFGLKATAYSREMSKIFLMVVLFSVLGMMIYKHDVEAKSRSDEVSKSIQAIREEMRSSRADLQSQHEETTYVLALPEADRRKLNLQMPEGMRRRMLSQERQR